MNRKLQTISYKLKGYRAGFTLFEILITFAVLVLVIGAVVIFQQDLFRVNNFLQETFSIERKAQGVLRAMISEIRTASQSNIGGYPIEIADDFSFAFYANVDKDVLKERVHYFLDGKELKKSVVKPSGSPLTYATTTASEDLRTVLLEVVASETAPIFSYYDTAYAGTTTPMTGPVDVSVIRMIGIKLIIDKNPEPPPAIEVGSQVSIRNLKDNL